MFLKNLIFIKLTETRTDYCSVSIEHQVQKLHDERVAMVISDEKEGILNAEFLMCL